jgi:hypothetical protein
MGGDALGWLGPGLSIAVQQNRDIGRGDAVRPW